MFQNSFGRPDDVVARETLENHVRQNDSFVLAVFQAQFRSSLTCPRCLRQSNTFDPFLCVSVPVPQEQPRPLYVTILYTSQQPRQVSVSPLWKLSLPPVRSCSLYITWLTDQLLLLLLGTFASVIVDWLDDKWTSLSFYLKPWSNLYFHSPHLTHSNLTSIRFCLSLLLRASPVFTYILNNTSDKFIKILISLTLCRVSPVKNCKFLIVLLLVQKHFCYKLLLKYTLRL